MFGMCSLFLIVCLFCQRHFGSIIHYEQAGTHFDEDEAQAALAEGGGKKSVPLASLVEGSGGGSGGGGGVGTATSSSANVGAGGVGAVGKSESAPLLAAK